MICFGISQLIDLLLEICVSVFSCLYFLFKSRLIGFISQGLSKAVDEFWRDDDVSIPVRVKSLQSTPEGVKC